MDIVFNFLDVHLCVFLDVDEVIFDELEVVFCSEEVSFEGAQQIADPGVFILVDQGHRLEVVLLVLPEHLALATGRPLTVFAVVVQTHSVLRTTPCLLLVIQQRRHDRRQLVQEPTTVSEAVDGLSAVGTLGPQS